MPRAHMVSDYGRHRRSGRSGRRPVAFFLCLGALALVFGPGLVYRLYGFLVSVPARYGDLEVSSAGSALAVRREEVLPAVRGGKVFLEAAEGERVAKGRLLARVVSGADRQDVAAKVAEVDRQLHEVKGRGILNRPVSGQTPTPRENELEAEKARLVNWEAATEQMITSSLAGTVSYTFDGLEGVLAESSLIGLLDSPDELSEVAQRAELVKTANGDSVAVGVPVVKIIDNFRFWLVAELFRPGFPVSAGERVRVRVWSDEAPGDTTSLATIVAVKTTGGRQRLVLSLQEYWPWFNQLRWANVEVIKQHYEGVIVPRTAVVERRGVAGVIVQLPRGVVFQPVTVRGGKGGEVVVDGVSAGTRIRRRAR